MSPEPGLQPDTQDYSTALQVCEVKYARVQGKDALIEHFRNSKFPSNDVDCLPLLFESVTLVRLGITSDIILSSV